MQDTSRIFRTAVAVTLFLLLVGIGTLAQAQEQINIKIQAQAKGMDAYLGTVYTVMIYIEQLSTPEDQKALIDAFKKSGNDGIVQALTKMKPKGRISPVRSVGNDVKYIREFPSENGRRRFRLVTDRSIAFGEAVNNMRSMDYNLSAVDITIAPDGKGSSGTLLPACKLTLNKNKEIQIETNQNAWTLDNIVVQRDK